MPVAAGSKTQERVIFTQRVRERFL
jgi:hypothetical protein